MRIFLVLFVLVPFAVRAASAPTTRCAPGRLVVKYRPTVDACAHCLLAAGRSFASVTGSDSLDHLNAALGVRAARPLFAERHGLGAAAATQARAARLSTVAARFPVRAGRASAHRLPDLTAVYVLELTGDVDCETAAARYAADPAVEYAEPDRVVELALTPDDPFFSSTGTWGQPYPDLWGLHRIDAATAWDTANGTGTVVAVVDSGVDPTHPDLAANLWSNPGEIPGNGIDDDGNGYVDDVQGWDFTANANVLRDTSGHGTHVAGIAAAVGNNGAGVVGVAWGARVMSVQTFTGATGLTSDCAAGMVYAAENGADVINDSWGNVAFPPSAVLRDAVDTALGLGAVVVAGAGNDASNVDFFEPAAIPGVIAAGAVGPGDALAGFSNRGDALSVTAPGIDVLSLLASGAPFTDVVAGRYVRLSGTSMATPHVAGLAAVLLSALPTLTPDEVRWHLELNADRIEAPGWVGQPWNPLFGWGIIDAGRVFDPTPVTTRLRPLALEEHAFVDASVPDVATAEVGFTTHSPVGWTLTAPSWLVPATTGGSGPADVALGLDTTGLTPGTRAEPLAVSAPTAVDGGASITATLHAHRDARLGTEASIAAGFAPFGATLASNGQEALLVWTDNAQLLGALMTAAGATTAPFVIATSPFIVATLGERFGVASDGDGFLVAWAEREPIGSLLRTRVQARRLSATGAPLDAAPLLVASSLARPTAGGLLWGAAFDGQAYAVLFERNIARQRRQFYVRWIGRDGTLEVRRRIVARQFLSRYLEFMGHPAIACATGACLVAWPQFEQTDLGMDYDSYAVPLQGRVPDYRASRRIIHHGAVTDLASDGTGYLALGFHAADFRYLACTLSPGAYTGCVGDVVAARVTRDGVPLDPEGFRVNVVGSDGQDRFPMGVDFDGSSYVAAFASSDQGLGVRGARLFVARVAPDGTVRDAEQDGLLVTPAPTVSFAHLAATPGQAIVAWTDDRGGASPGSYPSLRAQRLATALP